MLTHGLDKFKEYFAGFESQYVVIGGTACSVLFDDAGAPSLTRRWPSAARP